MVERFLDMEEVASSILAARTIMKTLSVPAEHNGSRLDVFLLQYFRGAATRSAIQRAIREGRILINEKKTSKPSSTIHEGQTVTISSNAFPSPKQPMIQADDSIPLRIIHEDQHCIVLDKQPGIPVHSGERNEHPTIADALVARYPSLASIGEDPLRPGIVHRLDQDTSGVLIIARTPEMFSHCKLSFANHKMQKTYYALVRGVVKEESGTIKKPIMRSPRNPMRRTIARPKEGRSAETRYRVVERFKRHTLLEVKPVTGRTHQIRVHLAHLGFPIAGDSLYGKQKKTKRIPHLSRQFLHATSIVCMYPDGKKQRFESPLPSDLETCLEALRNENGTPESDTTTQYRIPSRHRNDVQKS